MYIKRAIIKYGKENFVIEPLEKCGSTLLNEREKYYISYFDSYRNGYNSTEGGQGRVKPLQTSEKNTKRSNRTLFLWIFIKSYWKGIQYR